VRPDQCPVLESGHVDDLSRYLLMILSRHDAIAGLDLKYAQIRWVTWKYYALRGESLFCSYSPSANAIKYDQVRLVSIREHQASGVTGAYSGLRVENFISSYTAIRPGWQLVVDAHTAGPTHVCFGPKADKSGRAWFVR